MGQQLGIDSRTMKQVQGWLSLTEDTIPEMQREVRIGTHEQSNEMVLESADSKFVGVAAVGMRRCQLEVDFFFVHEIFEHLGCFVVKTLKLGLEAGLLERSQNLLVGLDDGGSLAILDRLTEDVVAVAVMQDEDAVVAPA